MINLRITGEHLKELNKTLLYVAATAVVLGFSIGLIGFMWNLPPLLVKLLG